MAITLQGLVTISRISQRERTTTVGDGGLMEPALRLTGMTSLRTHTLATARAAEQQIHELAWYSRRAGGVYIDSTELDVDDGLYEVSEVTTTSEPSTSKTAIITVGLTLRRLGGGPAGSNLTRRLVSVASLQTNSYSVTSTPFVPLPIGASAYAGTMTLLVARASKDGAISLNTGSSILSIAGAGADFGTGEVKIYDTTGSGTESDWLRVFGPDHTFSSPSNLVLENGLIRFKVATTNLSCHTIEVWAGGAWTMVTSATNGDSAVVGGSSIVATAYAGLTIDELTPYRAKVTFQMFSAVSPYLWTKSITLERGRYLALIELATASATTMSLGMQVAGRFVVTRDSARDHTVEAAEVSLSNVADNWILQFTDTSSIALGIGAIRTTGPAFIKNSGGGFRVDASAVTSLAAYLGGVPYACTKAWGQAEAGTLSGGALLSSSLASASGSGSNQVNLIGVNGQCSLTSLASPPTGSRVIAIFRMAVTSTANAGDTVSLRIWNSTTAANAATVTKTATQFTTANVWQWFAVEYATWNGTDGLYPYAVFTANATAADFYIDQVIFLSINQVNASQARDVANQALTEMAIWPAVARRVR